MPTWDLTPGAEQPIAPSPAKLDMRTAGVGSLTPMEICRRATELGCRVEFKGTRYRVYPPDKSVPPITIPDRFGDLRAPKNAVADLRRAGVDVLTAPDKEPTVPTTATSPSVNGKPAPKPGTPTPATQTLRALEQQVRDLLELVTELDATRQADNETLTAHITDLETRLASTPGAPPARDPNADLDDAILGFMRSTPIRLSAPVIAANLDGDTPAEQVAARMEALAEVGKVTATGDGSGRLYAHRVKP